MLLRDLIIKIENKLIGGVVDSKIQGMGFDVYLAIQKTVSGATKNITPAAAAFMQASMMTMCATTTAHRNSATSTLR